MACLGYRHGTHGGREQLREDVVISERERDERKGVIMREDFENREKYTEVKK